MVSIGRSVARIPKRAWILIGTAIVAACAAAPVIYLYRPLQSATGFISHTLCSGAFVSGLNSDQVYAQTLKPIPGVADLDWAIRYEVDKDRRHVRTIVAGAFESRAVFVEGLGCILVHGSEPASGIAPVRRATGEHAAPPLLTEFAGTAVVEPADARLRAALDRTFAEPDKPPYRQTTAAVVVHAGRIVAERYAPGYGVDTPLLGWSVTKSVTSALTGILVRQGLLSVDGPEPVPQWRDPADPRHAITMDMLLRMTSGLALTETNTVYDSVSRMLMIERDMAGFAERASLESPPGSRWYYTSGNTLILSRIIRDAVGGNAGDVLAFAHRELFGPLGMRHVTLEFDAAGTPIGSTYMYASARDWARFGMLYLEDGVVGGRRVLPEGWVRYSSSKTLDSNYAMGFWRGSSAWRTRWNLPEDAFFASGFLGQRVMVIPSERLVVVRFGNAHGPSADFQGFGRLVSDVLHAIRPAG
ncbi:MAG: serine hydrolase [Betaproteobacteria bacterium]|nr:serine hydrolase [Betaproteobacteria bacterium]